MRVVKSTSPTTGVVAKNWKVENMSRASISDDDALTRVSRTFRLENPNVTAQNELKHALEHQSGVVRVEPTAKADRVRVTYDVEQLDATAVGDLLEAAGAALHASRWQKLRIAWCSTLDGNQRDNANHHPACCSKPPAPGRRR